MLTGLVLALCISAQANPATAPVLQEWTVPWEHTRPRDPVVDTKGQVFFVGQTGNYLGMLDPEQGKFRRFGLPENTLPHNVVFGPENDLWIAGNGNGTILRMNPATGKVTQTYVMPDKAVKDPHTLAFTGDGVLWFTAQAGNVVGSLAPKSGEIKLYRPSVSNARPYGIIGGQGNRPWVAFFGTNRIATIDQKNKQLKEYPLPSDSARPRRLAQSSDGAIWYVDYANGKLGRLDPKTGKGKEWATPGGSKSEPYAMAIDGQNGIWFVESGVEPNVLQGFNAESEKFRLPTPIKSGGGTVRHMVYDAPSKSLWFGTDKNTIVRAKLP